MAGRGRGIRRSAVAAATLFAGTSAALAHAGDRGFVLLLPTGYYIIGGALAVAVSFAVLALLPASALARAAGWRGRLTGPLPDSRTIVSLASFAVVCCLLYAGFAGSRDPLSNPLPLVFWTVWWIGLTLAVGLFGNLWRWLDPWYGPWRLVSGMLPRRAPLALPVALGWWPAVALFLGFAWFELVDLAPEDPQRLATVLGLYWLANFAGTLLFGHAEWTRRVECFSVFFGLVSRLSPLGRGRDGSLDLALPGARAAGQEPLPLSATFFLLLALAAVSFDGLSRTFVWLSLLGINPLEFPGRSAVLAPNTAGLVAAFAALAGVFFACVWFGCRLAGTGGDLVRAAGLFVWSLLPIALAYHFAHYLTALVINGQYALAAVSDPLSRGWNLFGTAGYHVLAGATAGHESAWVIWNLQAAAIVAGHVFGVAIAHVQALRLTGEERRAAVAELPLAALMVGYTVLGLWLLSTPTGY